MIDLNPSNAYRSNMTSTRSTGQYSSYCNNSIPTNTTNTPVFDLNASYHDITSTKNTGNSGFIRMYDANSYGTQENSNIVTPRMIDLNPSNAFSTNMTNTDSTGQYPSYCNDFIKQNIVDDHSINLPSQDDGHPYESDDDVYRELNTPKPTF